VRAALEHHRIRTHGITLHVVQAGPTDGEIVIMLHGFPEFWMAWSRQLDALVAQGYRVWLPDQRGYNTSDKPAGIRAYAIDERVEDIRGLIEATGRQAVCVVGHDWGGVVAWHLAARYPMHVSRLVIVNAPHPGVMKTYARAGFQQLLKSWYRRPTRARSKLLNTSICRYTTFFPCLERPSYESVRDPWMRDAAAQLQRRARAGLLWTQQRCVTRAAADTRYASGHPSTAGPSGLEHHGSP
jgi:pimeloyl-ACP methyl ester carboxylesterase